MLRGAGGFGSFCMVLVALSLLGNLSGKYPNPFKATCLTPCIRIAATVYSLGLSVQIAVPVLYKVPRALFILLATAALIPVAIVGATRFFAALESFLGVVGYWVSFVFTCVSRSD